MDLEPIQKHNNYICQRTKRGLFRGTNYLLNADVNRALNILRKIVVDGFIQNLSDKSCMFQLVRIGDMLQTSYEQILLKAFNIS